MRKKQTLNREDALHAASEILVSVCRCAELEKELSVLKEKNHHLDDMLKSHQRKVRSMIEQVCRHQTGRL